MRVWWPRPKSTSGLVSGGLPIRRRLPTCPTWIIANPPRRDLAKLINRINRRKKGYKRFRLFDGAARLAIMDVMKRLALLLLSCSMLTGADLADVHTVYLLKMSKGMDKYV